MASYSIDSVLGNIKTNYVSATFTQRRPEICLAGNVTANDIYPAGVFIYVSGFRVSEYKINVLMRLTIPEPITGIVRNFNVGCELTNICVIPAHDKRSDTWNTLGRYRTTDGSKYWTGVEDEVKERFPGYKPLYVNGMYRPHSTAQERYTRGVEDALRIIKGQFAVDGSRKSNDRIYIDKSTKIILLGHSHGAWHAIGMADKLAKEDYNVVTTFVKNPHQPNHAVARLAHKYYRLVQYSTPSDHVSSEQKGLKLRKILVGRSEYKGIPGAEFVELPECPDCNLGGHDVDLQFEHIADLQRGETGYFGR